MRTKYNPQLGDETLLLGCSVHDALGDGYRARGLDRKGGDFEITDGPPPSRARCCILADKDASRCLLVLLARMYNEACRPGRRRSGYLCSVTMLVGPFRALRLSSRRRARCLGKMDGRNQRVRWGHPASSPPSWQRLTSSSPDRQSGIGKITHCGTLLGALYKKWRSVTVTVHLGAFPLSLPPFCKRHGCGCEIFLLFSPPRFLCGPTPTDSRRE